MPTLQVIKPIETVYSGYRFRSRLEARWAVFFDVMKIKYEYEMEGYDLGDGVYYLPDFYLPDLDVFVEIKPHKHININDVEKLSGFCMHVGFSGRRFLLIIGTPGDQVMLMPGGGFTDLYNENEVYDDEFFQHLREWFEVEFRENPFNFKWNFIYKNNSPYSDFHLKNAINQARQARFEFYDTKIQNYK